MKVSKHIRNKYFLFGSDNRCNARRFFELSIIIFPAMAAVQFTLHNELHTVDPNDVTPETTLLKYLRDFDFLRGTKYMCEEGGCGACIVAVTAKHPVTKRTVTFAVNSCLVSIYSCDGWEIHTVEGIGNKSIGYHPVQKRLAAFNGTQCGFCSPGMVMNMYALYEAGKLTMKEVEESFGGNMCRCTGYRPILSAFKSLCSDADKEVLGEYPDVEDLNMCNKRGGCLKPCRWACKAKFAPIGALEDNKSKWYKVFSINEIFDVLRNKCDASYQLVAGNTARGVYPTRTHPDIYIDITSVGSLLGDDIKDEKLIIGSNKTLNDTIELFRRTAELSPEFSYLNQLADHIKLVAHVPVRNIGTIAGNLSIKHNHKEFPSDIFLLLEAVGAKLTIVNSSKKEQKYSVVDYLSLDMKCKVIKSISLPKFTKAYKFGSYKIMQRAQNAHAIVNAAFLLNIDGHQKVQSARIVYGGINPEFSHATKAEQYLKNKTLFDNDTLQGVFKILDQELQPDNVLPQASPKFRKGLAIALFYKFVISIAPAGTVSPEYRSGGLLLTRPVSNGAQDYQTNKSLYPLTQPIAKLEALGQTSGEVEYITDIPEQPRQLYAYFVTAKAPANSTVTKIDASKALKVEGVVAFYDKDDIPGPNTFVPMNINYPVGFLPPTTHLVPEELFCSGTVKYYFQPLGVVVANSQELAERAADLVKVTYAPGKNKPLLTIRQILKDKATDKIFKEVTVERSRKGTDVKRVVKGSYDTSWQYHYHMETQNCVVIPKYDSLDVYPGSQWMDITQVAIASVLAIPENKINVYIKRVGGAFGAKITRNCLIACATALAAYKLQKPVRMRMTFSTNMDVIGKRFPGAANYEVGLDDDGKIQYLDEDLYLDYGYGGNEPLVANAIDIFTASYDSETWTINGYNTRTDTHGASPMRAPGSTNMMAMVETIMEHIAMELNISPIDIRLINMSQTKNKKIMQFIDDLIKWADYDKRLRAIEAFNKSNRWIKKSLSLVPMTYPIVYLGNFISTVAIYAGDGSVAVTHGGVEIGQGIHTKVAQVCAFALNIPLDMVSVKGSNNMASANCFMTARSITSEQICYATLRACETLLNRMKPIRDKMKNPTWQELVKECQNQYVDLVARYMSTPNDPPQNYEIFGVVVTEVQVDILTGIHQVTRVDLLEDTGNSLSPVIDIGQVEGAFVMGLGYWTTEKTVYNEDGRLLTNRTWNYKVPCALDIPIDFRVKFPKNNPNPGGVLHSKTCAEAPLCLSSSIPFAIRRAVASARAAADPKAPKWYPIRGPSDVENTFLNSLNDYKQYII